MEPTSVEPVSEQPANRGRVVAAIAVVTVMVLIIGVIGAFSVGGGSGGSGSGDVDKVAALPPGQVVLASADATAKAGTAHFTMTLNVDLQVFGQREQDQVDANGDLDFANHRGHITETIPAADGSKKTIDIILDGSDVYVGGSALDGKLPAGKTYVKVSASALPGGAGLGATNPMDTLQALNQVSGDVHEVGKETVGGVDTVHYAATVDPSKAPALAGLGGQLGSALGSFSVPIDVWIDGDGRTRQLRVNLDMAKILGGLAALGGGSGSNGAATGGITMQMNLSDFGKSIDVTVPPASAVAPASSIPGLGSMAGMLGGTGTH